MLRHNVREIQTSFTCSKWNTYISKSNIFGLKMMVKTGLEKMSLIPSCTKPILDLPIYFIKGRVFVLHYKFSNKNDLVCAWRGIKKFSTVADLNPGFGGPWDM